MSERGVFAVDRGIFDHPLLSERRKFSRLEAWLWLLSEAEWKPTTRRVSGRMIALNRGQLVHSIRFIAEAWGWSKSAVDRFLGCLKTGTMIGTESGTGFLVITICKYDEYQKVSLPKLDIGGTLTGTAAGQQRDRLENSESIEGISSLRSDIARETPLSELSKVLSPVHAKAVIAHRTKIKKALSLRSAMLLAKEFSKCPDPDAAADMMLLGGWQGFKAEWALNKSHGPPGVKLRGLDAVEAEFRMELEQNGYGHADQEGRDYNHDARLSLIEGPSKPRHD